MTNAIFKTVKESNVTISQLMLPSHTNFSGKIHGGYILSLLDQIAFACASKFAGYYCVTASVDTVDFIAPVEVGDLVTMKASVNYVGHSSIIVGIRVEAENIKSGVVKHCNSSYFTMVAKDEKGVNAAVPGLVLSSAQEIRRFNNCIKIIALKKERSLHEQHYGHTSQEAMDALANYNVRVELK